MRDDDGCISCYRVKSLASERLSTQNEAGIIIDMKFMCISVNMSVGNCFHMSRERETRNCWMTNPEVQTPHLSTLRLPYSVFLFLPIARILQPPKMHRCACSTRALDAFVKDFAGLNLRCQNGRPQTHLHQRNLVLSQRRSRGFAMSSSHRLSMVEGASAEKNNGETVVPLAGIMDRRDVRAEKVDREEKGLRTPGGEEGQGLRTAVPLAGIMNREVRTRRREKKMGGSKEEIAASTRSKAENRYLRKLRRMQAGTFRPLAGEMEMQGEEGEQGADIAKSALRAIDGMEGPRVQKRTQKGKSEIDSPVDSKKAKRNTTTTKTSDPNQKPHHPKKREDWQIQKSALASKLSSQPWNPRKRVSPDTLSGIRALHASDPTTYTTPLLAQHFQISPDAVRRILKSKWQPSEQEVEKRMERWERRGVRKWEEMASQGQKPPRKWREMGVENPVLKRKKWEAGKEKERRGGRTGEGWEGGGVAERIL